MKTQTAIIVAALIIALALLAARMLPRYDVVLMGTIRMPVRVDKWTGESVYIMPNDTKAVSKH